MKIILRNEICDKLENIVKDLKVVKHCIGCEGLDLNNKDPHHHPSIEITQKCNLNCIYCYSKIVSVKEGIYGLDIDSFNINRTNNFKENNNKPNNYNKKNPLAITISQYGEPLLYPEKVKKSIKYVKSLNLRCDLQTNGVLLNENLIKDFKDLGLDIIMISLSAFSQKTYKTLTNTDYFYKVLENIKISSKYIHTIVRCIHIPNFNENELIELAKYLNDNTEVKEIMLHQLIVYEKNKNALEKITDLNKIGNIKDLLLLVDKIRKVAPNINTTIKGCLLVHLKNMDGFMLSSIKSDCITDVPTIKRDRKDFKVN